MGVVIQNVSSVTNIPDNKKLESWAMEALNDKNKEAEVTLRIVDEEEGKALNKNWRNKDYATNVLSFPIGETFEQAPDLLGDIVICAPVVEREANEQGKKVEAHWAHMIVHGLLHIQGYDHEVASDAEKMEEEEIKILDQIGFANPYESELQE